MSFNRCVKLTTVIIVSWFFFSCGGASKNNNKDIELIPIKTGKLYQYINKEGDVLINPQFKEAGIFSDGLAKVKSDVDDAKWKFINKDGKYVFSDEFVNVLDFSEGISWVVKEDSYPTAINKSGEIVFSLPEAKLVSPFSEGLAAVSLSTEDGMRWGFVDKKGEFVISPQFLEVKEFSLGKCAVAEDTEDGLMWGYINSTGKLIINHQFPSAGNFVNNLAVVRSDDKEGLINDEGKYIINPQYDKIFLDGGDLYIIVQNGKTGFCDKEGKIVINPQFEEGIGFLNNDLAPVKITGKFGYINKQGKIIINPQFDMALPFNNGIACVKSGRNYGFINEDGKYVINPQFNRPSSLVDFFKDQYSTTSRYGNNTYNISTDFFDISGILSALNLESESGTPLELKIDQFLNNNPGLEIKLFDGRHEISSINANDNHTNIKFNIYTKPYKKVQDGWYEKKVYDPTASIYEYEYRIDFDYGSTGYGKLAKLHEEILNQLANKFDFDNKISTDRYSYFNTPTREIKLTKRSREIRIEIKPREINLDKTEPVLSKE